MNVARLYLIASKIVASVQSSEVLAALSSLSAGLNNQISSPDPSHLSQIETAISTLESISVDHEFKFPETWNSDLAELGALDVKNGKFVRDATLAVKGNEITLQSAKSSVDSIQSKLSTLITELQKLANSFEMLGIEEESQPKSPAEVSVLMPRRAYDDDLHRFSNEVESIANLLELAEEIATGSRSPVKLGQLSSTDPVLLAGLSIPACLVVVKIAKDIIDLITSTYKLREARAKALEAEASVDLIKEFDKNIAQKIEDGVQRLAENALHGRRYERGRRQELRNELDRRLQELAARIDNGYRIEGNADGSDLDEQQQASEREAVDQINEISAEIQYQVLPPQPVLAIAPPQLNRDDNQQISKANSDTNDDAGSE